MINTTEKIEKIKQKKLIKLAKLKKYRTTVQKLEREIRESNNTIFKLQTKELNSSNIGFIRIKTEHNLYNFYSALIYSNINDFIEETDNIDEIGGNSKVKSIVEYIEKKGWDYIAVIEDLVSPENYVLSSDLGMYKVSEVIKKTEDHYGVHKTLELYGRIF